MSLKTHPKSHSGSYQGHPFFLGTPQGSQKHLKGSQGAPDDLKMIPRPLLETPRGHSGSTKSSNANKTTKCQCFSKCHTYPKTPQEALKRLEYAPQKPARGARRAPREPSWLLEGLQEPTQNLILATATATFFPWAPRDPKSISKGPKVLWMISK